MEQGDSSGPSSLDGSGKWNIDLTDLMRGPHGEPTAALIAAEALWATDLGSTRGTAWPEFRRTLPYANHVVQRLRQAGFIRDRPTNSLAMRYQPTPLPRFRSEADLREQALEYLSRYFTYALEVPGVHCSGSRLRIDAVLRPRDPIGWKDEDPAFGVEFKLADQRLRSTNGFMRWARQAVDYTHVDWEGFGRLRVFACPSPIRELGGADGWFMAHLLGQFGVGELIPIEREGWALTMHGDHIYWSERRGVAEARHRGLRVNVGGR